MPIENNNWSLLSINIVKSFVKSTYKFEGDGALAFSAYKQISKLGAVNSTAYHPNVNVVVNCTSVFREVWK